MKAIIDALNVVYDEDEKRGVLALDAVSLLLPLELVCALAAIGLVIAAPIILAAVGLSDFSENLIRYGRWPSLGACSPPRPSPSSTTCA